MALAATVTSCSKNDDDNNNIVDPDVTTMPEGTSDPRVTINETDADYNDPRYQANWGNYAEAVSSHLKNDAETLYKAWNEGLNGGEAFQTTFKEAKGAYHSYNDCIEQILDGCIDIANEVGESKIGDPRDQALHRSRLRRRVMVQLPLHPGLRQQHPLHPERILLHLQRQARPAQHCRLPLEERTGGTCQGRQRPHRCCHCCHRRHGCTLPQPHRQPHRPHRYGGMRQAEECAPNAQG